MKFNYQARTEDGQIQTGVVEANNKEEAIRVLQRHSLYISFLEEEKAPFYSRQINAFDVIKRKDVVLFSRQLSIMFKSGVNIVESLKTIGKQTKKNRFKEEILKIADKVESGNNLSQALSFFPKTFTPFYIGMVKSGEASGKLSDTLEYLADHMEREYNFNNKIVGAIIYPAFVFFAFIGIIFFMMTFVIPRLGEIFEDMSLPLMTKIVLGASNFIVEWWWFIILIIISVVVLSVRYFKSDEGRKTGDKIVFRIPLINEFIKKINLVKVAENLSTLISGGLPIIQAIEVTSEVVTSDSYKKIMIELRDGVRKGELMSSILQKYPDFFSPLFVQMIMVGEKTGKIDSSLENVVRFYQGDIDRSLENLVKLLEPIMIIMLGVLVGIMIVSILMPIYQISF